MQLHPRIAASRHRLDCWKQPRNGKHDAEVYATYICVFHFFPYSRRSKKRILIPYSYYFLEYTSTLYNMWAHGLGVEGLVDLGRDGLDLSAQLLLDFVPEGQPSARSGKID